MKSFKVSDRQFIKPILIEVGYLLVNLIAAGKKLEIRILSESKTRDQEAKYHCMIKDIADQIPINNKLRTTKIWKALLVDGFEHELISTGESLTHSGQLIVSLDGERAVMVRPTTSEFRKHEGSQFIEYLYMKGAEYGTRWTEKSLKYYEENRHERKQRKQ